MSKVSVRVPEDLKKSMDEHEKVNWSEIAREAFREEIRKIELADSIASRSELTEEDAEEIGEKIKQGLAERHGLNG